MKKRLFTFVICIALVCALAVNYSGCTLRVAAKELTEGYARNTRVGRESDDAFVNSQFELAAKLFRESLGDEDENAMISPLSICLALAMLANGAEGETLAEIESVIGGDIPIEALNEYLAGYVASLPSDEKFKLSIANSIWLRDDSERFEVKPEFLQTNVDYYDAEVFAAEFDDRTARDMNNWVSNHTDGMIDEIVDTIDPTTMMYLVNTILFDAEWMQIYERIDVRDGIFTAADGERQEVEFMHSDENRYIETENATGFFKYYRGGYSFVALLPREGLTTQEYLATLDGESLRAALDGATSAAVKASIPKFEYEYEIGLKPTLSALGIRRAFDAAAADLSRLGSSPEGNIFVEDALHKTYITVDARGTRAGAVTVVVNGCAGEEVPEEPKVVLLDRPFVYMIVDNECNLPIFIGTVNEIDD